jgi:hypothetical protein
MIAESVEHAKKRDMQKKKKRGKRTKVHFTHMMPEKLNCEFWQDLICVVGIYTKL